MFFCNYSDSYFVKKEKLDILLLLSNDNNINDILIEIREYINEVDIMFIKKCITFFGKLAIKNENNSNKCINLLIDCIKNKSTYLIQETIIVIKDIF